MTRRELLTALAIAPQLKTLTREGDSEHPLQAEGFILRGTLKSASTDGSKGYYQLGSLVLALTPESVLLPTTDVLCGADVELKLVKLRRDG